MLDNFYVIEKLAINERSVDLQANLSLYEGWSNVN